MMRYSRVILVPERKSSAQAIIDSLTITLVSNGIDPFKRIYNVVADNHNERKRDYLDIQTPMSRRDNAFYDRWKKILGFNTTGASRDTLYGTVLQNAAKNSAPVIKDRTLSSEIRGLVVKNGRIDHNSDSHDDFVIAWLLAHWFLTHSKNLSFYGIDPRTVMVDLHQPGKPKDPYEQYLDQQQKELQQEIEHLYECLSDTNDEWAILRLEAKLRAMNQRITSNGLEALSIDGIIEQAKVAREEKNRQKRIVRSRRRV